MGVFLKDSNLGQVTHTPAFVTPLAISLPSSVAPAMQLYRRHCSVNYNSCIVYLHAQHNILFLLKQLLPSWLDLAAFQLHQRQLSYRFCSKAEVFADIDPCL